MSYSKLYLRKNSKTLYILSVLAFISFFVGGLFSVQQFAKKNGWKQIKGIDKIYVVNRTPHGFDIVWSTTHPTTSDQWVEVGTKKGTYPIVKNIEKHSGFYYSTVTGLTENTRYYFRIRSGSSTYILPSLVSDVVDTPKPEKEKPVSPAYGKVLLVNTRPYANGLLIYEIDGFYPLSVFTKETGEWLLPLTGLIEKKDNKIKSVAGTTPVVIKLPSFSEGVVRTVVSQTRPLKQVIIAGSQVYLAQVAQKPGEAVLGATSQTSTSSETSNISQILYPKENAVIPGNSPLIKGIAPSGKDVVVLIQGGGKQYSYRATANEKGEWVVQSPVALPFGRYTIVVTIQNGTGATTVVRRTFSIIKSGEQVLGEATGSPTLAPTAVVPTYANPTSAIIPTTSPTAVVPTYLVPTATPPVTGGGISSYLFGALFFIVVGAGLVLAF